MLAFYKKQREEKKTVHHWPLYLAAVFFILADLLASSYLVFQEAYKNKIYPGVSLGEISLGGKTADEAKGILETRFNNINQNGVQFDYGQTFATITPIISSFNGDIALQVINFDSDDTIKNAFGIGRGRGLFADFHDQLAAMFGRRKIIASIYLDNNQIRKMLADNFSQFAAPPQNANIFATTTDLFGEKKSLCSSLRKNSAMTSIMTKPYLS